MRILFFSAVIYFLFPAHVFTQCVVTVNRVNYLDVNFDRPNNEFVISGFECDSCEYQGTATCECHVNCREQYGQCVDICTNTYGNNPIELAQCLDVCILSRFNCFNNCGVLESTRLPEQFFFGMALWYTSDVVETFDGPPNFVAAPIDGNGGPPDPIIIPITIDLTNMSISYCYQTTIFVVYDDGVCCQFIDAACVNLA